MLLKRIMRIMRMILMFNALVSPFIVMKLREPPRSSSIVNPIDVDNFCDGLEQIPYKNDHVEFVDVRAYLKELDMRENRLELTETNPKKWAYYDELKEADFIVNPTFYETSYNLTSKERDLIERVVMHEAGWCPDYRLLVLTAQCFRNDCELNDWKPDEVYSKCGYLAMDYANPRAKKAVSDVFDKGIQCVPEQIFCYYNRNLVHSADHERHNLAIDINGNRFFY